MRLILCLLFFVAKFGHAQMPYNSFELTYLDIEKQEWKHINILKDNSTLLKDSVSGKEFPCNSFSVNDYIYKSTGKHNYAIYGTGCFTDPNGDLWYVAFNIVNVPVTDSLKSYYEVVVKLGRVGHARFNDEFPVFKFYPEGKAQGVIACKMDLFHIDGMKTKSGKEFSLAMVVKQ